MLELQNCDCRNKYMTDFAGVVFLSIQFRKSIIMCVSGWDISSMDLGHAMERAQVLDWSLQEMLRPHMSQLKPRPSIYIPDFIAANQDQRADNILTGTKAEQVQRSK